VEEEVTRASQLMKKFPDKESVEWFELLRMRCVDRLRALLSIKMARENAVAIGAMSDLSRYVQVTNASVWSVIGTPFGHDQSRTSTNPHPRRNCRK
jgi:hypothetical protein